MSTTILITGASGFIGQALVRRFEMSGWKTWGIGRRITTQTNYLPWDLSRPLPPEHVHRFKSVDVILHAAARSSPWGTRQDFQRNNVQATQNVVQLAELTGAGKLIFVSSSSVYYRAEDQFGIQEKTPQAQPAVNLYAESKQAAEAIVNCFRGSTCILRPRAVYGVGDSVLFPRILVAANAGRLPLLIRAGEPVVGDLLSIQNLVEVCYRAAEDPRIAGDFNLTDNQPVEIIPFLMEIFRRLEIAKPKRTVSVKNAFRAAWCIENLYRLARLRREPPITRFGVHVFAYSKTFDVSKMLETFGPPQQTVSQAVDEFIDWVRSAGDPYGLKLR